ncbi:hypothetical protein BDR22DRAFT_960490 [Usnea florida]
MYNGGGTILLLSTSSLRYLGKRIGLSSTVERVPALSNASQSQHYSTILLKPRLTASRLRRTYAQKVVSRAKANTGGATTSATKAAKKPAPKKTTPKSLPKAKSKAKPVKKTTKAKTKAKKPKAKKPKAKKPKVKKTKAKKPKAKKPKKELTAEEKTKKTIKELRAKALKAPSQLVTGAWTLFLTDKLRAAEKVEGIDAQGVKNRFGDTLKAASAAYKELTAEQLEQYNHLANQNKAANAATYREWIESHTPMVIHQANLARRHLTRLGVKTPVLKDERQVAGNRSAYAFFTQSRFKSGDYKNMKVTVAGGLAGREWKALTDEQKKPFRDLAAQDYARYTQERKTVLNLDAKPVKSKKLTA